MSDGEIIRGDCLKVMASIPSGSIDMIMVDLPYGTTGCKWDSIVPLGPMWSQVRRVIKPSAAIVMTASQPFTTTLISSNIKMFKYSLVWEKDQASNFLNFKYQFGKIHEDICVFGMMATSYSKKGTMNYYPQMIPGKPYSCKQGKAGDAIARDEKTRTNSVTTVNKGTRYPTSVLKFQRDKNKVHPTQKPVALMEYLIKTYTNEGELVLDFTCGSGSTCVACVNTNRDYIGIEKDEAKDGSCLGYIDIARSRVQEAKNK
jgi:site-specific DNA-methyltransferase (adenine-specific)